MPEIQGVPVPTVRMMEPDQAASMMEPDQVASTMELGQVASTMEPGQARTMMEPGHAGIMTEQDLVVNMTVINKLKKWSREVKRLFSAATILLACTMLSGCFEVKNTDGLRAAYEKVELAYPLAAEIRKKPALDNKTRQEVIDSYNEAKAALNSFLEDAKTKSVKTVDIPREAFEKDKASKLMDDFIRAAKLARGRAPASAEAIILIAGAIIEKIWELNKKDDKEAYDRFVEIIDKNKMVDFSKVPGP